MYDYMKKIIVCIMVISLVFTPVGHVFAAEENMVINENDVVIETESNEIVDIDESIDIVEEQEKEEKNSVEEETSNINKSGEDDSVPYDPNKDAIQNTFKVKADEASGALTFEYPIELPEGRNGMIPNIGFTYNSQNTSNEYILGYGWTMSIPYIERVNKKGVDRLYVENYFTSSLSGELTTSTLVDTTHGEYISRVSSGENLKYIFNENNSWSVYTKEGQIYTFGQSVDSKQTNENDTKTYKWMVERIEDVNGNSMYFEYTKETGQIYPSRITYTNIENESGIYEVNFTYESREDDLKMYNKGFEVWTQKRLNEIEVKVSGEWVKKYDFSYGIGDNGVRGMFEEVVVEYRDSEGNVLQDDPVVFEYSKHAPQWEVSSHYGLSRFMSINGHNVMDEGKRIMDINGDGLNDAIKTNQSHDGDGNPVVEDTWWINNGAGYTTDWVTTLPVGIVKGAEDYGVRIFDINGDYYPDFVHSFGGEDSVAYIHNGQYEQPDWGSSVRTIPVDFAFINGSNELKTSKHSIMDANKDGIADIFKVDIDSANGEVYLNRGDFWDTSGFEHDLNLSVDSPNERRRNFDINGDGLQDIIFSRYDRYGVPKSNVYINDGYSGWYENVNLVDSLPEAFISESKYDFGARLGDVNGDGLLDLLRYQPEYNVNTIYLNTGIGWTRLADNLVPTATIGNYYVPKDNGVRVVDMNGDGMVDFTGCTVGENNSDVSREFLSYGMPADLLINITTPSKSITKINYKPSTQYRTETGDLQNSNLPVIIQTANEIITNDGFGNISTTTYQYTGGKMYYRNAYDRKFAGFERVEKIDGEGNISNTYFHQGDDEYAQINYPYKTEMLDSEGNVYKTTHTNYTVHTYNNDKSYLITPDTIVTKDYDGNDTHRDTAESFVYNTTNGNLEIHIQYGEVEAYSANDFVDILGDTLITNYTYAIPQNQSSNIVGFPSSEVMTDFYDTKVRETKYTYDNLSYGQVEKGNVTKVESWIEGEEYISQVSMYNVEGLVTSQIDAKNNITTIEYDEYNLYPNVVTDDQENQIMYTYNYSNGKPIQVIDQNENKTVYIYDGKGRILTEKISDPDGGDIAVFKTRYTYVDDVFPRSIQKREYLNNQISVKTITYINGFDLPIQEKKQTEFSYKYNTKDYTYTKNQQLKTESLPYESNSLEKTNVTENQNLITSYTYDALGRQKTITNVVGTTTYSYNNWSTIIVDALNNSKTLHNDAFDRLVQVDEYNNDEIYLTRYSYTANNNLSKITDAHGNVRNFSYDGLGRRLSAEDLHAIEDETFGVYTFVYDNNSNIVQNTTPNNDTVYYTYDSLNRKTTESLNTQNNTQVQYFYDSCQNGKTRLCATATDEVFSQFKYDGNGNIVEENRTVDQVEYAVKTTTSYDRQGNIQSLSGLDGDVVYYTYNSSGLLDSVERNGVDIIKNIDYSPLYQVKKIEYGNDTMTSNVYNSNELYRLKVKNTSNSVQNIQNLNYSYDAIGNITGIYDGNAQTSKRSSYVYDDLYRLISVVVSDTNDNTDYTRNYSYDALGNILNKSDQGDYVYEHIDYANPHAVTSIANNPIQYDNNGNMTEYQDMSLSWNYANRLIYVNKNNIVTEYGYDHDGQRIYKTSMDSTTIYPNKYLELRDGDVVQYIYAGNTAIATIENDEIYYSHTDHLSGSNIITNEEGGKIQTLEYFPFGEVRINDTIGEYDEKKKFTGYELDDETDLYYAKARYYGGGIGRFVGVDPVSLNTPQDLIEDPQALNLYAYSRNNPFKYVDPSGEMFLIVPTNKQGEFGPMLLNSSQGPNKNVANAVRNYPGLETVADAYEIATGKDIVTGEKLSGLDRGLTGVGLALPVSGSMGRKGKNVLVNGSKGITEIVQKRKSFTNILKKGRQELHVKENHFNHIKDIFKKVDGKLNLINKDFYKHILPHTHIYKTDIPIKPSEFNKNYRNTFKKLMENGKATKKTKLF
jgi:RHS repeat-associated protein